MPAAAEYFKARVAASENRIGTGFIGTPALLPALVKIGAVDLAAAVFLQERVPGWLYQVKTGATTIWERWDAIGEDGKAFDPEMNSYNHYAYGAVCQWLFEGVAGFRPDPVNPGFKHIIFEPTIIPQLSPVAASHDSAAGRIEAGWSVAGREVTYDLLVPEGASGTLMLAPHYTDISVDGAPPQANTGTTRRALAPGRHRVTFRISSHGH
jgi:alpha-L-rhamnosidase